MRWYGWMVAAFLAGCSGAGPGSPDVGGECTTDKDCSDRCTFEDMFGRGMCTRACTSDKDCPDDSVCVDKENGICAVSCTDNSGCEGFGRAFGCDTAKRRGGGESLVCRLP